jgi:hypothetical protein
VAQKREIVKAIEKGGAKEKPEIFS